MAYCLSKKAAVLLLAALGGVSGTALAQQGPNLIDKVYVTGGLQGFGVGVGQTINPRFGARAEFSGYSMSDSYTESGNTYDGTLKLRSGNLLFDFFPFAGTFRLTGGVAAFGSELKLGIDGPQTVEFDGRTYALGQGEFVRAKVEFPSAAPYLGLGWGHGAGDRGFYFSADLGVYIGNFKTSLDVSDALRQRVELADPGAIERERQALDDSVADVSVVPSLQSYIGYRF